MNDKLKEALIVIAEYCDNDNCESCRLKHICIKEDYRDITYTLDNIHPEYILPKEKDNE